MTAKAALASIQFGSSIGVLPARMAKAAVHAAAANPKLLLAFFAFSFFPVAPAQVPELARHEIDRIIGAAGVLDSEEGLYKVVLPRDAATVVLDYQSLPSTMGLNSWAAFSPGIHHAAVVTGQILLLEDEVDAVVTSALNVNLEVAGLADTSFFDGPSVKVLDISGIGTYQHLASSFHTVVETIQRTARARATNHNAYTRPALSLDSSITPGPLDDALSMYGVLANGIYRASIGRGGTIYGENAGREMGLATWICVSGNDQKALAHGEIIAIANELQMVLRALRSKTFHVISVRNHFVGEHPGFYFVEYWGEGRSVELARSLRFVLEAQIAIKPSL